LELDQALRTRSATRAFLDRRVDHATIRAILDAARWAPSGVNTQPWQLAVVECETRERLTAALIEARKSGRKPNPDYAYYPDQWRSPYRERRKACGLALYGALGIGREDKGKAEQSWNNNYRFFGAPVGLFFLIDRDLNQGSWLDLGMFVENVMLAALDHGLATCPQASLADYPDVVREVLALPDGVAVACGMSLGYPDPEHPVNRFRTEREAVDAFTRWYE